jgi:Family of unknown function (DUF6600)
MEVFMARLTALRTSAVISALALLAFSGSAVPAATPAAARINVSIGLNFGGIGFGYFHQNLSRRGHWINHPIWGDVWVPPRSRDYRPYFNGYWIYSDYGLLWVGFDPWSNITDHYGRWVWDPFYGWLWIPGYVWGPGWVIWRTGDGYFGWMAMPPDYGDYDDGPYFGGHYGWDDYYGYSDWYGMSQNAFFGLWIFVDDNHFYRRDYRNYAFHDSEHVRSIMDKTNNATDYVVQDNRIVNRSISADRLERITHERIQPVEARKVFKGEVPMATVTGGRNLAQQEGSGRAGPHFHDRNFQPLNARGGKNEGAAAPLIQREPERNISGRNRGGKSEALPSPQPQSSEERGRSGNRGGENAATPSPQPQGGEQSGGARNRVRNEATPSPQPMPNSNERRGRGRGQQGQENNAAPLPQPSPVPESQPGLKTRAHPGSAEGQPAATGSGGGAEQQGVQGPDRQGKDKGQQGAQPPNPDREKHKKHDGNGENGPGQ